MVKRILNNPIVSIATNMLGSGLVVSSSFRGLASNPVLVFNDNVIQGNLLENSIIGKI